MKQQLYGGAKAAAPNRAYAQEVDEEVKDGRIAGL